jgi:hypothetical protein
MQDTDYLLDEQLTFLGVKFHGTDKVYYYKTLRHDYILGDKILVKARGKLAIVDLVEIVSLEDVDHTIDYLWAIQKIDTTEYDRSIEVERKLQKLIKRKELMALKQELLEATGVGTEDVKLILDGVKDEVR